MKNFIISINVFLDKGLWVFDDDRVGLQKEPFVSGADTLIDKLAQGKEEIQLIFSDKKFPGSKIKIERMKEQRYTTGTEYFCEELSHELWLCPALNLYYPISPEEIYIDFKLN